MALAVAAGAGGVSLLTGDDDEPRRPALVGKTGTEAVTGPDAAPFRLVFPDRWDVREQADERSKPGSSVVSLRRADGTGALSLRVGGRLSSGLETMRTELREGLRERLPQARLVTSRIVEVVSGDALLTLWIDTRSGRVQSNLVVPDGERSYVLDAVVAGRADAAARDVAAIFSSFRKTAGS